ncbi:rab-GTPase-TBC domain-containing protein [Rhodotorula diobovata]|uniref:Rab-GTPase-TBC domain-containing protein n=1 Tax=Rhodotorula diobovata TaxID=5288 RepID=A0A5C5FRH1_9BASI|nr:rab-GTPase-TBC domain-containing protein [Rhodotorula diobovata]
MSALAQAITSEDGSAVQLHDRGADGSRLGVHDGAEVPALEVKRRRAASGASLRGPADNAGNGLESGADAAQEWARLGATTPPARSLALDPADAAGRDSPEHYRGRSPSGTSQDGAHIVAAPPRTSSISPTHTRDRAAPRSHALPSGLPASPPQPVLNLPHEFPTAGTDARARTDKPLPPAIPPVDLSSFPPYARNRNLTTSNSLSSSLSAATSNSSHVPHRKSLEPPQAADLSPYPSSSVSFNSYTDPDGVAALVQRLYARLDEKGVHGDGWDEGKERSRDGIILREVVEADGVPEGEPIVEQRNVDEESKADHILRRVDRYGFFSNSHPAALSSQHHNIFTLSAAPFDKIPSTTPKKRAARPAPPAAPPPVRPSTRNLSNRHSTISLLPSTAISPDAVALETKRVGKWGDMLSVAKRDPGGNAQDWVVSSDWWSGRVPGGGGGQSGKYRRLQRRVFKGIPDRWRRAVWGLMLERMASEVDGSRRGAPSLEQLKAEYEQLVAAPYVQDVQIDLDVPRTISGHVMFHTRYGQGQRALFHVLHAFGLRCEEIGGYCQGMGSLAATLLCYFEPERAYVAMCRLFDQYRLAHIFAPGFPGLHEAWHVQQKLVELLMPDVHASFEEHCVHPSSYSSKWYLTLYTNSFPFATQLRLWDALLLEGIDVLVIIAVAVIWHFQHEFTAPNASFESILTTLGGYFFVESDDALLRWLRKTLRLKGLRDKMRMWRDEYRRDNPLPAGAQ